MFLTSPTACIPGTAFWQGSILLRTGHMISGKHWRDRQNRCELYETQPARIRGNILCLENPGETVLGFFFASGVTEKRIFMWPNIKTYQRHCTRYGFNEEELLDFLSTFFRPENYPIYLYRVSDSIFDYADQDCFDCRLRGGQLDPPPFWED